MGVYFAPEGADMKSGLLITAAGLVLLGVVGYILIPKLLIKSEVEHIDPSRWRVILHKTDGYINTGIQLNDENWISINAQGESEVSLISWIAKINDTPYRGTGSQDLMACIRGKRGGSDQCAYVPENYRGTLYLKNDSAADVITIYVQVSSLRKPPPPDK